MPSPRTSRYQLRVTGRFPETLRELVDDRFGPAAVVVTDARCTVVDIDADQAALRALLTLLWDVGHEVHSISRSEHRPGSDG
jgi:hypothetical protein